MIRGTYGVYKGEVHFIEKCGEGKFYLYPNSESEIDDTYIDEYNIGSYSKIKDSSELTEMYELSSYVNYKGYKISIAREVGMSMNYGLPIMKLPKSIALIAVINTHTI